MAREVLYPLAPEYDRKAEYPWPQLKALAELGLLGMTTPEEWGGVGLDSVTWALALEELAAADPSVAVIVSVTSGLPQYMLLRFGSEAQKRRYLVPLARGEWIGAFCLTEPQAGSDAKSLRAEARRVKGGFVLNGVKSWITSAGHAHLYVVMARTEKGISAFLVEKGTPGLSFGRPEEKMGLHAAHTAEVRLDRRPDGIGFPGAARLAQRGDVVDVDAEEDRSAHCFFSFSSSFWIFSLSCTSLRPNSGSSHLLK